MTRAHLEAPKLDPREQHFRVPSPEPGLSLFLRYLPPAGGRATDKTVLYVHGGTFPSALSIAHRFDGRSWRDALCDAGFHVWGLDFHGFGLSDRYPEMAEPAEAHAPLGRAAACSRQLEAALRFICERQGVLRRVAGHAFLGYNRRRRSGRARCPELVDRLVFFGPIARREPKGERQRLPGWRLISLKDSMGPVCLRSSRRRAAGAVCRAISK